MKRRNGIILLTAGLAGLAALGVWRLRADATAESFPANVMGTETQLKAVAPAYQRSRAEGALAAAERALRDAEARMSSYLDHSELSRLNDSSPGTVVPLSPPTLEVLRIARREAAITDGAFDVTCRPLLLLWRRAGKEGRLPAEPELRQAMGDTGWRHFELLDGGAVKKTAGARIDLGGIAKKYGIDRAVEAMKQAGVAGGLVNVGGDIRCFGRRAGGGDWTIGIRDPFQVEGALGVVRLKEGSVCTSGNYERFVVIDGKRHSHIVDPRTGMPADAVPSVTVIGPDAMSAGLWATALSVLGPPGLAKLPRQAGLEALVVAGTAEDFRLHVTEGFGRYLVAPIESARLAGPAGPDTTSGPAAEPAGRTPVSRPVAEAGR